MLHLHPERVKLHLAKRDGPKHTDPYRKTDMQYSRPVYFVNEFHEVSRTGTIGHPDLASAAKGKKFLDGMVKDVTAFVDRFAKWCPSSGENHPHRDDPDSRAAQTPVRDPQR